ncbi:MAG TPA: hypothetical protein DFS52_02495 [Myxococcales bacterium]|jgi:hypothetical protein|nr:hypothetical protein [Myxococcales bacterium]
MPNPNRNNQDPRERTDELTGFDATMDEAEPGSAGNGAAPYGADMTGGLPKPVEDTGESEDILPDQVQFFPSGVTPEVPPEEEPELSAQPSERMPLDPSEFP